MIRSTSFLRTMTYLLSIVSAEDGMVVTLLIGYNCSQYPQSLRAGCWGRRTVPNVMVELVRLKSQSSYYCAGPS